MVKYKTYVLNRMNMPFTISLVNNNFDETLVIALDQVIDSIDKYFKKVEEEFSPFIPNSLVSRHTDLGEVLHEDFFDIEYQEVYSRSILAKKETRGLLI